MGMYRSVDTSCSRRAMGNSGASASGPMGLWVAGWMGGGSGEGRSALTLYHCVGICFSSSTYLYWLMALLLLLGWGWALVPCSLFQVPPNQRPLALGARG